MAAPIIQPIVLGEPLSEGFSMIEYGTPAFGGEPYTPNYPENNEFPNGGTIAQFVLNSLVYFDTEMGLNTSASWTQGVNGTVTRNGEQQSNWGNGTKNSELGHEDSIVHITSQGNNRARLTGRGFTLLTPNLLVDHTSDGVNIQDSNIILTSVRLDQQFSPSNGFSSGYEMGSNTRGIVIDGCTFDFITMSPTVTADWINTLDNDSQATLRFLRFGGPNVSITNTTFSSKRWYLGSYEWINEHTTSANSPLLNAGMLVGFADANYSSTDLWGNNLTQGTRLGLRSGIPYINSDAPPMILQNQDQFMAGTNIWHDLEVFPNSDEYVRPSGVPANELWTPLVNVNFFSWDTNSPRAGNTPNESAAAIGIHGVPSITATNGSQTNVFVVGGTFGFNGRTFVARSYGGGQGTNTINTVRVVQAWSPELEIISSTQDIPVEAEDDAVFILQDAISGNDTRPSQEWNGAGGQTTQPLANPIWTPHAVYLKHIGDNNTHVQDRFPTALVNDASSVGTTPIRYSYMNQLNIDAFYLQCGPTAILGNEGSGTAYKNNPYGYRYRTKSWSYLLNFEAFENDVTPTNDFLNQRNFPIDPTTRQTIPVDIDLLTSGTSMSDFLNPRGVNDLLTAYRAIKADHRQNLRNFQWIWRDALDTRGANLILNGPGKEANTGFLDGNGNDIFINTSYYVNDVLQTNGLFSGLNQPDKNLTCNTLTSNDTILEGLNINATTINEATTFEGVEFIANSGNQVSINGQAGTQLAFNNCIVPQGVVVRSIPSGGLIVRGDAENGSAFNGSITATLGEATSIDVYIFQAGTVGSQLSFDGSTLADNSAGVQIIVQDSDGLSTMLAALRANSTLAPHVVEGSVTERGQIAVRQDTPTPGQAQRINVPLAGRLMIKRISDGRVVGEELDPIIGAYRANNQWTVDFQYSDTTGGLQPEDNVRVFFVPLDIRNYKAIVYNTNLDTLSNLPTIVGSGVQVSHREQDELVIGNLFQNTMVRSRYDEDLNSLLVNFGPTDDFSQDAESTQALWMSAILNDDPGVNDVPSFQIQEYMKWLISRHDAPAVNDNNPETYFEANYIDTGVEVETTIKADPVRGFREIAFGFDGLSRNGGNSNREFLFPEPSFADPDLTLFNETLGEAVDRQDVQVANLGITFLAAYFDRLGDRIPEDGILNFTGFYSTPNASMSFGTIYSETSTGNAWAVDEIRQVTYNNVKFPSTTQQQDQIDGFASRNGVDLEGFASILINESTNVSSGIVQEIIRTEIDGVKENQIAVDGKLQVPGLLLRPYSKAALPSQPTE